MDLNDVTRALRRFWLLALTVLALTVAAGYLASTRGSARFEATTTLSVSPNPAVGASADTVGFEMPVIVERVASRSFRRSLADTIDVETLDQARDLSAEPVEGSGIVHITAAGRGRDAVADVANAAAEMIIDQYTQAELVADPFAVGSPVVVEVIDDAVPAGGSGRPSVAPIVLASVVLGAILATAAAVLAQQFVRSRDPGLRVRDGIGTPVLAEFPAVAELNRAEADFGHLIAAGPPRFVGAIHALRARVEDWLGETGTVVAVTSWERHEGRTTVAAALGVVLASVGRTVVVIDADLERPELHNRLGIPPAPGLAEFEPASPDRIVRETPIAGLGLVYAGVIDRHPAQVLAVALPPALEQIAKESPDTVVIIDAPPLRPSGRGPWVGGRAETSTALRAASHVLVVVDAATNDLDDLARAVGRLDEGGVALGAVLNRRPRRVRRRRSPQGR